MRRGSPRLGADAGRHSEGIDRATSCCLLCPSVPLLPLGFCCPSPPSLTWHLRSRHGHISISPHGRLCELSPPALFLLPADIGHLAKQGSKRLRRDALES